MMTEKVTLAKEIQIKNQTLIKSNNKDNDEDEKNKIDLLILPLNSHDSHRIVFKILKI